MPDPIIHLIVPLLVLLALIKEKDTQKLVVFLSPFALFPDIDILSGHRSYLHNIFIPLLLLSAIFIIKNEYHRKIILISAIYISSHIFLDIFNGGTTILYPFYNETFLIKFNMIMDQNFLPSFNYSFGFVKFNIENWDSWKDINIINPLSAGILSFVLSLYTLRRMKIYENWNNRFKTKKFG